MYYVVSKELYHHGIIGQKWGVRRFQNKDGSLTSAGRVHYGASRSEKREKALSRFDKGIEKAKNSEEYKRVSSNNLKDHNSKIDYVRSGARLLQDSAILGTTATVLIASGGTTIPLAAVYAPFTAYSLGSAGVAATKEGMAKYRIKNAETDPKTGLKKKSHEMTPEKDAKAVNPGYHNYNDNTKNNCTLCSLTFEMRRRGYDMIAPKASQGFFETTTNKWFKGSKTKYFSHDSKETDQEYVIRKRREELSNKYSDDKNVRKQKSVFKKDKIRSEEMNKWIHDEILKQGEGARGEIQVSWSSNSGHSLAYIVEGNNVAVYDGQTGKKYDDFSKLSKNIVDVNYTRRDNLEPDYEELRRAGII